MPFPAAKALPGFLGQSLHSALCHRRLHGGACDAPGDTLRGSSGLKTIRENARHSCDRVELSSDQGRVVDKAQPSGRQHYPRRELLLAGAGALLASVAARADSRPPTEVEQSNQTLVQAFCSAWAGREVERLIPYLAEDLVYQYAAIACAGQYRPQRAHRLFLGQGSQGRPGVSCCRRVLRQ